MIITKPYKKVVLKRKLNLKNNLKIDREDEEK